MKSYYRRAGLENVQAMQYDGTRDGALQILLEFNSEHAFFQYSLRHHILKYHEVVLDEIIDVPANSYIVKFPNGYIAIYPQTQFLLMFMEASK